MTDSLERKTLTAADEDATMAPESETENLNENPDASGAKAEPEVAARLIDISIGDTENDLPEETGSVPAADEIEIPWGEAPVLSDIVEEEVPLEAEKAEGDRAEAVAPTAETTSETVAAATGPVAPFKRAWYVVHCYSGYENKVKKGLEQRINSMGMQDRIYRVVVPIEKEVEIKEGQRRNIERRVFPGYILVEMMELNQGEPVSDEAWYVVRNTPGVTGFVSSGDKPVPLREDEVTKILNRMESEEPKVHVTFRSGQTVHIIDGPFADFRGTVDNVDMSKGKVRVLVSFFGRETPVELDLLQVEKV